MGNNKQMNKRNLKRNFFFGELCVCERKMVLENKICLFLVHQPPVATISSNLRKMIIDMWEKKRLE